MIEMDFTERKQKTRDYFRDAIIPNNTEGIRTDIAEMINADVNYCWDVVNGNEEMFQ